MNKKAFRPLCILTKMLSFAEKRGFMQAPFPYSRILASPMCLQSCVKCDNCLNEKPREKSDLTVPAAKVFILCTSQPVNVLGGYVSRCMRGSNAEKLLQISITCYLPLQLGQRISKKQDDLCPFN